MRVSVIIPNLNGEEYLSQCLVSLSNQTINDFEIILVDNASTDNSVLLAKRINPNIRVVQLMDNEGFSKAVNIGIRSSLGKYVLLLNNDTIVFENFIEELLRTIETDNSIFSCSSKMISYFEKDTIDDIGDALTIFGLAYQEGHGHSVGKFTKNKEVFSSCAGAAMYQKEVFELIGYFDERFFAYLEDVDIGYRARIHGYKNLYCANAQVYHIGSATSGGGYTPFKVYLSARNNVFLIYKNMPVLQLILNLPLILVGQLMKYIFYKKVGLEKSYLKGIKDGLDQIKSVEKVVLKQGQLRNVLLIQCWLIKKGVYYSIKKFLKVLRLK